MQQYNDFRLRTKFVERVFVPGKYTALNRMSSRVDFKHLRRVKIVSLACFLWFAMATKVGAKSLDSNKKPALPPISLSTAKNVYGDAYTKSVEQQIIAIMRETTRSSDRYTRSTAVQICKRVDKLTESIENLEQLERLAFWCQRSGDEKNSQSGFAILHNCFYLCLQEINKRTSCDEGRARIYELANLINADGHSAETIEELINQNPAKRPVWHPVCCYVGVDNFARNATCNSIDFNLTRILRQKWYTNWTGKYRYAVHCTFTLTPEKTIKDLEIDRMGTIADEKSELYKSGLEEAKRILNDPRVFDSLPAPEKPVMISLAFFD